MCDCSVIFYNDFGLVSGEVRIKNISSQETEKLRNFLTNLNESRNNLNFFGVGNMEGAGGSTKSFVADLL